jgi:hypothetical protein
MMRPRLAEHAHHLRQRHVRPRAHVKRLDRKPHRLDADHVVSSRNHAVHAPETLVSHSIVIRVLPVRTYTRIERSGAGEADCLIYHRSMFPFTFR